MWGWCSDINRTVVNKDPFRKGELVGEDGRLIKRAIAITIDQSQDAMLWVVNLNRCLLRVA